MNPIIFLTLFFFICAAAGELTAPVLDVQGNRLEVGTQYVLSGVAIGSGHVSIASGTSGHGRCPQNVVKPPFTAEYHPVVPVIFHPANKSETVVRESVDLNFEFTIFSDCSSNVWTVHPYDGSTEQYFITTGGEIGNPGCGTIRNWFQIVPVEETSHYKLVVHPQVCDPHGKAADVIIVNDHGQDRLRVNVEQDPTKSGVLIRFVRVPTASIKQVV